MISESTAKATINTLTHTDVITVAAGLLVLLVGAIKYIFKINVGIIDQKITSTCEEIDQLRHHYDGSLDNLFKKVAGIEAMAASSGLKVQDLSKALERTKALTDAYIDRTERDINRLENRLNDIEKAIKQNHQELSAELHKVSQNVAVLISKAEK